MSGPEEKDATFIYNRYGNPSLRSLEATLASIEGAKQCAVFATGNYCIFVFADGIYVIKSPFAGMAASTALVTAILEQGDHMIAGNKVANDDIVVIISYIA